RRRAPRPRPDAPCEGWTFHVPHDEPALLMLAPGLSDERPAADGVDHLRQSDFKRLAEFIEAYSGIKMPPSKMTMVEGRLRRRVRETGAADLSEYCQR